MGGKNKKNHHKNKNSNKSKNNNNNSSSNNNIVKNELIEKDIQLEETEKVKLEQQIQQQDSKVTAIITTDDDADLDDDEDEEEEEGKITEYWVEDSPMKQELYDREKFGTNLLASGIPEEPKVQFNRFQKIYHFNKHPTELSQDSYYNEQFNYDEYEEEDEENYSDSDQEYEEDGEEEEEEEEEEDDIIIKKIEDDDEEDDIYEQYKIQNIQKTNERDEYDDYDELNDSSSEEIQSNRTSKKKNSTNFRFYTHHSSESDTSEQEPKKSSPLNNNSNGISYNCNDDHDDDDDDEEEEEEAFNSVEEHSDIEQENLSIDFNKSTENNNNSNIISNNNSNVIINQQQTPPQSPLSNVNLESPPTSSPQLRQWATRPQVKYVSKYPSPNSSPTLSRRNDDNNSSDNNSIGNINSNNNNINNINNNNSSSDKDKIENENEESEEDNSNEENSDQEIEINLSGSDIDNEEIQNIIRNRSSLEQMLMEARSKAEVERVKLREYFNQAKVDLKKTIENVSQFIIETAVDSEVGNDQQPQQQIVIKNELEEVSSTLIQLENKIIEIEDSLKKSNKNDSSSSGNSNNKFGIIKNGKSKIKINSLLTEFVHLKQQIEKEKTEKMNRDTELKDITEHLLEMASQLSKAIIYRINADNNSSFSNSPIFNNNNNNNNINNINGTPIISSSILQHHQQQQPQQNQILNINNSPSSSPSSSTFIPSNNNYQDQNNNNNNQNQNNNNNSNDMITPKSNQLEMEKEIEFYRKQIEQLEKRLMSWKHHNEMLHLELLNDKQNNSEELLNLSFKIKKVEEERDKLSLKIDELMADVGEKEGIESVLSSKIEVLKNDNHSLFETIEEMQKEREFISDKFNQIILEIREMGENNVEKLQDIINELTNEREELHISIREAETQRFSLIGQLCQVTEQLNQAENYRKTMSAEHANLLLSCESTFKALESSELKCTQFQSQLQVVNRRLSWTETEVDRLTKEIDRLGRVNFDLQLKRSTSLTALLSPSNSEEQLSQQTQQPQPDDELINSSTFNNIKDRAATIKNILSNERNEIIQLGTDLSLVIEKGKINSKKTIQCLKDFILKEMEFTKSDISNKLGDIELQKQQIQSQNFNNEQLLLEEMNQQRLKLNEMQQKILKIENQITNNNDNNSQIQSPPLLIDDRDQFTQLRKLENKIRKIEAGISEIVQTPPLTPSLASTTIVTTTTHHTYLNNTETPSQNQQSSSLLQSPPISSTITTHQTFNNDQQQQQQQNDLLIKPNSSSSSSLNNSIDGANQKYSINNSNTSINIPIQECKEKIDKSTCTTPRLYSSESSSTTTPFENNTTTVYYDSIYKSKSSSSSQSPQTLSTFFKSVTINSILLGTSSSLSIMYYKLLNNNNSFLGQNSAIDLTNKDQVISLLKFGCKFGLFIAGGYSLLKLLNISNYPRQQQQTTTPTTTATIDPDNLDSTNTPSTNVKKNYIISGVLGATLLGGILFYKERKPIYLLTGSLIGFSYSLILNKIKYNN